MFFEMKIYDSEVGVDLPIGKGCSSCFTALVNYHIPLWISANFLYFSVSSYVIRLHFFKDDQCFSL